VNYSMEPTFEDTMELVTAILDKLNARIEAVKRAEILKSYEWYDGHLHDYAGQLYRGKIDDSIFLDKMIYAIGEQLGRAWNEGMVENKLDPVQDKTPEMEDRIKELVDSEYNHVTDLIDFIQQQKQADAGMNAIDGRVDMWVNRYNDVVNIAKMETAGEKEKLEWVYGDTEHCSTCEALNGIIATASEWQQSGFHPQQPDNPLLECGGWRCQCSLNPTDKRKTPGALGKLMDMAMAGNI
jgi:hypothetical protein